MTTDRFWTMNMCRLCFASSGIMFNIGPNLSMINLCLSLKIYTSNELSNKICQNCIDKLNNIKMYRQSIIKNQLILSQILKNSNNDPVDFKSILGQKTEKIYEVTNNNTINLVVDSVSTTGNPTYEKVSEEIYMQNNKILKEEENRKNKDNCIHTPGTENIFSGQNAKSRTPEKIITDKTVRFNNNVKVKGTTEEANISDISIENKQFIYNSNEIGNNVESDNTLYSTKGIENVTQNNKNISQNIVKKIIETNPNIENATIYEVATESNMDKDESIDEFNVVDKNDTNQRQKVDLIQDNSETDINLDIKKNYVKSDYQTHRYPCLTCLKEFGSKKDLAKHYTTEEFQKAVTQTSKKSKDPNIFNSIKDDKGKTIYKCGICGKLCSNKKSVIKHAQVHKVDRPYLCNLCGRTYKMVSDILRHGVVHYGCKMICLYKCGYSTVHLGAMREHVRLHRNIYKYKCDKCDKQFQVKTWYEQHKNVHDEVRPFVCKLCGQSFSMDRYLSAHMTTQHPQTGSVKRYKCTVCAHLCDSKKCLTVHKEQNHGLRTEYLCDVCGKILQTHQKLHLHKNIHKVSRMFSCRFCKKSFNKNDHKVVHEKIHTGERLICNSCSKSFTQRCSLRRHVKRYHQGDLQLLEIKKNKYKINQSIDTKLCQ